ncbi:SPFH domain containing protein [Candidatus Hepatincola sp. Av]
MFILIGLVVVCLLIAILGLRIIYQFEEGVIFTLGKYTGLKKAGLNWIIPFGIQDLQKIDMRLKTVDVQKQEIITKDNISIMASAVVYFRISNAEVALIKVQNINFAVSQFTQAALRDVVGNQELDVVLAEREKIGIKIKEIIDAETANWGVFVENIKIQEIEIPQELKRAMAKQAEAERERRAMIISSDGELQASKNLQDAAEALSKHPAAMQLRTLQTIRDISTNSSQKIVMFMPNDFTKVLAKITEN